jgi:hypothetical protein
VWKYRTGDVCCVIVVLLSLSVFESLRIREIRQAWTSFGDVEVSMRGEIGPQSMDTRVHRGEYMCS